MINRLENNLKILEKLKVIVENNPELRFHQLLFNSGINEFENRTYEGLTLKDKYSEESQKTLEKLII